MIDLQLLKKYGSIERIYEKGETIFEKGGLPKYYFQVVSGEIKMNSYNDSGKEFIQGIFSEGRSFGEPPLFGDLKYPANAVTLTNCKIEILRKENFKKLLLENPEVHFQFSEVLASRLYYKAIMASEISGESAEHRILALIDYLKIEIYKVNKSDRYEVDLTRQQIADLTGLRVETVIRAIKKLTESGEITVEQRKVFR